MRVLHLTDTHLGADGWYRGAPPGWRRADDHLAACRAALAPALREEVDAVVHTGDVFDRSKPPRKAIDDAAALFVEVARRVPVLLMPGNHDRHGLRLHYAGGLPGVQILDEPTRVRLGDIDVVAVPYRRDLREGWVAPALADGADLLLSHQSVDGCTVPGFTFRVGLHAETVGLRHLPRVPRIANGHIHPRQVLRLGETEVVFAGSTERTSFVERHQPKGYVLWRFDADARWSWVDLPTRPMQVLAGEAELDGVRAGALVQVKDPALDEAVLARGGWVRPRSRAETRQASLFATRAAGG